MQLKNALITQKITAFIEFEFQAIFQLRWHTTRLLETAISCKMHIFVIPDNFPSINNNMNIPGDFEYQVGKLYRISKYEQSS